MRVKLLRLSLLALLGWSLKTHPAPAQAPAPVQVLPAGPEVQIAPAPESVVAAEGAEAGQPAPRNRLQGALNNHGMGCYSPRNQIGCGNFWNEFAFVFGSCRTFFGQPCAPNPGHFGPGADGKKCCGN